MSIYDNGNIGSKKVDEKRKAPKRDTKPRNTAKTSNQTKSANVKNIRNDKDLTAQVKEFDPKIGAVKEIIYDHDKKIIGLLKRSGDPHFFSEKESKDFTKHIGA